MRTCISSTRKGCQWRKGGMVIQATRAIIAVSASALSFTMMVPKGKSAGSPAAAQQSGQKSPTSDAPFDPHDFTGIWRMQQGRQRPDSVPPMTPWAQALFGAAKPGLDSAGSKAQPLGNDPIMTCEPVGYPRILSFGAYPVEFVQTKDKILELFDFFYTRRTIWLDGRSLPKDPELTWYGQSTGHWEGDTLIVESNGFNGEPWVDNSGHPYSDQATLEERYRRVDHDHIQLTVALSDPKAYAKPWVIPTVTFRWTPQEVMREDLCAPSDEKRYLDEIRQPAGTKPAK